MEQNLRKKKFMFKKQKVTFKREKFNTESFNYYEKENENFSKKIVACE